MHRRISGPQRVAIACAALGFALSCARNAPPQASSVPAPDLRAVALSPANDGRALPREAYRATLALSGPPPAETVKAGGSAELTVVVTNRGTAPFPAFPDSQGRGAVNLTCRTYRAGPKREVVGGCNRSTMPADLKPGESVTLKLTVPFPAEPGAYEVDVELVHETIAWFVDFGSQPLLVRFRVS